METATMEVRPRTSCACRNWQEMVTVFTRGLESRWSIKDLSPESVPISEMIACSGAGCHVCTKIISTLKSYYHASPSSIAELCLESISKADAYGYIRFVEPGSEMWPVETHKLCVTTQADSPVADLYPRRPIHTDLSSPAVTHQVSEWIQHCLANHRSCPQRRGVPYLPTRVIDVVAHKLHLTTPGERSTYTALSYCWGSQQSYTTTTASITSLTQHLNLEDMPATIRDAIKVTASLGIKYLWVDALCIIQDSESDKEIEITGMNKIYKDSTVTILAANAPTVHDGFLHPISIQPGIEIPFQSPSGTPATVQFHECEPYAPDDLGPLYHRAWALQERLLSPRLLIYSAKEVLWRCAQTETPQQMHPSYFESSELASRPIVFPIDIYYATRHDSSPRHQNVRIDLWLAIVQAYSQCALTLPQDKLPALAGIATELHTVWGVRYLAGFWEQHFVVQLAWYLESPVNVIERRKRSSAAQNDPSIGTREAYRAPSWSWAAVDGPICHASLSGADGRKQVGLDEDAVLVGYDVKPLSLKAPLGQVEHGWIKLEGYLVRLIDVEHWSPLMTRMDSNGQEMGSLDETRRILDCNDEDVRKQIEALNYSIWILVLLRSGQEPSYEVGLLLEEAKDGLFRRVGFWQGRLGKQISIRYKNQQSEREHKSQDLRLPQSGQRQVVKII